MMLVDADAVDAAARGVDQLIKSPVVVLADLGRIGEFCVWRVDPHRMVALLEIRRQVAIRHQMEHRNFHARSPNFHLARAPQRAQ
jgi:hypothetical protein